MRMRLVVDQLKVVIAIRKNRFHLTYDPHLWQSARLTRKLCLRLFDVIGIQMNITQRVDEFMRFSRGHVREHEGEQCVGCDVKRYSQEDIRTALIQLAGEATLGHVKLEQAMTGRKRHPRNVSRIPRANDQATRVRIVFDLLYQSRDLVNFLSIGTRQCRH